MRFFVQICLSLGLLVVLTSSIKQETPIISGLWSEHWIDSDVDYVDTLRFTQTKDSLFISLHNLQEHWSPRFYQVNFDGSILRFQMDANNITNFFLLKLSEDQKKFEGKVYTWKGAIRKIYFVKQGL